MCSTTHYRIAIQTITFFATLLVHSYMADTFINYNKGNQGDTKMTKQFSITESLKLIEAEITLLIDLLAKRHNQDDRERLSQLEQCQSALLNCLYD